MQNALKKCHLSYSYSIKSTIGWKKPLYLPALVRKGRKPPLLFTTFFKPKHSTRLKWHQNINMFSLIHRRCDPKNCTKMKHFKEGLQKWTCFTQLSMPLPKQWQSHNWDTYLPIHKPWQHCSSANSLENKALLLLPRRISK